MDTYTDCFLRKIGGEVCKKKMPYSSNQKGRELKSKDQEEIQINKRGDLKIDTRKRCDQIQKKRFQRKEDKGEELMLQREKIPSYTISIQSQQYEGEELNET